MKSIYIKLTVLMTLQFACKYASAQWTTSGSNIYFNTGKVGLGTTNPISGLSMETASSVEIAPLSLAPNGSAWIGASGSNGGISIGQYAGFYGYLQARSKVAGVDAFRLAINPLGGNVGIGITYPTSLLHIKGSGATPITLERTTGTNVSVKYVNSSNSIYTGLNANGGFTIGTTADLLPSSVFTATSTGNIGIGTTTPTEKLYVRASGLLRPTFESITSTKWFRTNMDFKRSRGTLAAMLPVESGDKLGSLYFWGYDGTSYIESSEFGSNTEGISNGVMKSGLYFSTNDGPNSTNNVPRVRMYITASGNVMINPKIDAWGDLTTDAANGEGKLQVRGLIRAQEVKVETANWPDYVFSKDYRLPTLQETEKHIKEKGHLSGIPSAAEVKTNGIELGDMNAKLLQKIEELTLYLIEQNNNMKKLQRQNEELRSEVEEIKTKL